MHIISQKLRIGGMTCVNCQNKVERKLLHTPGVSEVSVSYSTGIVSFRYDSDLITLEEISAGIEKLGYQVLTQPGARWEEVFRSTKILLLMIVLYCLLQRYGILNLLVPSRLADTTMGYGMMFVIGLITSVHCIAMCGGINLSQCIVRQEAGGRQNRWSVFRPSLLYNMGRVISYTVVGFILGFVGMLFGNGSGSGMSVLMQGILKLTAGVIMVIMGINMLGIFPWLRKLNIRPPRFLAVSIGKKKRRSKRPLIVGLLNGLMPCGPLQSMQIVALASGNPFAGALSMLLFSLGTVPLMLGLGSLVSALGRRFTQKVMSIGAVLVVVLGLAMLSQGGSLSGLLPPDRLLILVIAFSILGVIASIPFRKPFYRIACFMTAAVVIYVGAGSYCSTAKEKDLDDAVSYAGDTQNVDGVQVVNSTLSIGRYPNITVQAGIPVKWVINAPEGSINGCNYKMLLKDFGIEYSFHEGENIIEFTPEKAGTYDYTCWMGMIHGNIFVTDGDSQAADSDGQTQDTAEQASIGESTVSDVPVRAGYKIPSEEILVAETVTDAEGNQYQEVSMKLTEEGFYPAVIVLQSGIQTIWNIELSGPENEAELLAPLYATALDLVQGENELYLFPSESFDVSTGDHRFYAYVKVVEDLNRIDEAAIQKEVDEYETYIYPDSIFYGSQTGASCCAP